ncbi:metalloregulator ArsR/SmtB family transcription factor [Enterococcus avium]|uniref:ArsR/SmtB family transcription factor n=1 Tax=Enterococcus avium TaxID=33945 RepID=UPI002A90C4E9|nr:metalloregulator ArsR/SmtB family transcription factor [Enterococcus avium]MDY6442085.1 metalloregulator ArsR/SmtB family transcription factor [Enterococcus avium]MDY6447865.1 metalloregulator ArsR/SmtB family transcription factor [Enterococcus avium]MDY6454323.1 metalloregulator ArsR/SmtB family transcription factor [Enterococcus avium]MDY6474446.1 metalloregulator ArsR/SmtB family transcription factor [Enterococcus avium]
MYSTNKKIFEQYSLFGKALANSNRLEIMSLLMQSPKTVERIAKDTNLSVANVSKHLQMLLKVHLVKNRKYKNYIYYEVINKDIEKMLTIFFETAQNQLENLSEIETDFSNSNEYVLTIEDLEKRLSAKDIVLIDVRSSEEYLTAHIPGAISIPLQDLESMIEKLPEDKEIVAYCRGPHCLMSKEAITILKEHGRQAVQFNQSVNDWNLHSVLQ